MKICTKCNIKKELKFFPKRKTAKDGTRGECKKCTNKKHKEYRQKEQYQKTKKENWKKWYNKEYYREYRKNNIEKIKNSANKWAKNNLEHRAYLEAKRRSTKLKATLKGFDKELQCVYKNCPKGYHVDHIVPLKNKKICGLHVPWNLQYLPAIDNIKKGNKYGS